MIVAVAVGYAAGGRLANVSRGSLRWAPLALAGLALQFISVPGRWPLILLAISFLLLLVFGIVNRRVRGFTLIILGISLNFLVIGVNHGVPDQLHALIASGQQATLTDLVKSGGAKHHIAASDDQLLFLGHLIAIPPPAAQVVSVGDICTDAGVGWVLGRTTRGRRGGLPGGGGRAGVGKRAPADEGALHPGTDRLLGRGGESGVPSARHAAFTLVRPGALRHPGGRCGVRRQRFLRCELRAPAARRADREDHPGDARRRLRGVRTLVPRPRALLRPRSGLDADDRTVGPR